MPFYTGKTKDGSDMKEVKGMYSDGEQWSNKPFTKEHRAEDKEARDYQYLMHVCINNGISFQMLQQLVVDKKPTMLSARQKKLLYTIINPKNV